MKKLDIHAPPPHHLHLSALRRSYIAQLLPLLQHILAQPAFSSSFTKTQRAHLVKFAADVCLVNAAGANARWGIALRETLVHITTLVPCADHHHHHHHHPDTNITHFISTEVSAAKTIPCKAHYLDVSATTAAAAQLGIDQLCVKKSSRIADQTYCKYEQACTNGSHRNMQKYAITQRTSDKYQGVRKHGDSHRRRRWTQNVTRQRNNHRNQGGSKAHGKDIGLHAINGRVASYSGRIRKIYAKPNGTAAAVALASSNEEQQPHGKITMASQIEDLQQLIPGGTALMDVASLLEETGLYILALQMQVQSLNALANAPLTSSSSS